MKRIVLKTAPILVSIAALTSLLPSCDNNFPLSPKPVTATYIETISLMPLSLDEANIPTEKVTNTFFWKFDDIIWSWELRVPESLYEYFTSIPRKISRDYSVYLENPIDDSCLVKMANELHRVAEVQGYNEKTTVEFAASFVQGIGYSADEQTTGLEDYPRYPLQTLADKTGDCEDTAILLTALLNGMGYNAALIYFPETAKKIPHYGVGIAEVEGTYGTNWEYDGIKYFYLETTEPWWRIGAIPGILAPYTPEAHIPKPSPFIQYGWDTSIENSTANVTVKLANIGQIGAPEVDIVAGYAGSDESVFHSTGDYLADSTSISLSLDAGEYKELFISLPERNANEYTLVIQLIYDGDSVLAR